MSTPERGSGEHEPRDAGKQGAEERSSRGRPPSGGDEGAQGSGQTGERSSEGAEERYRRENGDTQDLSDLFEHLRRDRDRDPEDDTKRDGERERETKGGPRMRPAAELVIDSVGIAGEVPSGTRPPGRRYLLDSESRVIFVRRHPALLLRYVAETMGALLLAGLLTTVLPDSFIVLDLIWYGVLAVMARLLYQVAEWSADRFVVTDRRMLLISGLITRKVAMMPLTKVTDMTYEKPVIGRLLGYGEFIMESAGQDQALRRIRYVPAPDRLYREVSELLFGGATASPKVVPSTAKARGAPVGQPTE